MFQEQPELCLAREYPLTVHDVFSLTLPSGEPHDSKLCLPSGSDQDVGALILSTFNV